MNFFQFLIWGLFFNVSLGEERTKCPLGTDTFGGEHCISLRDHCRKSYKIMAMDGSINCKSCDHGYSPNVDASECILSIQEDERVRSLLQKITVSFKPR